jgi:hypothetical protein
MVPRTSRPNEQFFRHVAFTTKEPPSPSFMERFLPSTEPRHEEDNETTSERSMIASDSTENIQVLRANLHAATVDQDQQSIDDSTSDRQRLRRRYKKKSSSNKKKVRREKRNKKHKRSRHKKVRSPDQGDDSSLSSDSLSSSSPLTLTTPAQVMTVVEAY